jgi:hypothetical protein
MKTSSYSNTQYMLLNKSMPLKEENENTVTPMRNTWKSDLKASPGKKRSEPAIVKEKNDYLPDFQRATLATNSFSFKNTVQASAQKQKQNQGGERNNSDDDNNIDLNYQGPESSNTLLSQLDKEIQNMKKEADEYKQAKENEININKNTQKTGKVDFITNYIEQKPKNNNYISVEELQQMKEEQLLAIYENELEFFKKYQRAEANIRRFLEICDDEEMENFWDLNDENFIKFNQEEDGDKSSINNKSKISKISKISQNKSKISQNKSRIKKYVPISEEEEKYLTQYASYKVMKKRIEELKKVYNEEDLLEEGEYSNYYISQGDSNTIKSLSIANNNTKNRRSSLNNLPYGEFSGNKEISDFMSKYGSKTDINITIPKPFYFNKEGHIHHGKTKEELIKLILGQRRAEEELFLAHRFKANYLNPRMFDSELGLGNVIEEEMIKRKYRTDKIKERIIQEMKPFSFVETDERNFKQRANDKAIPQPYPPFKASAVPWTSQVLLYDDKMKKEEQERRDRVEIKKEQNMRMSRLPPRMEMHKKKIQEKENEEKLMGTRAKSLAKKETAFKATPIPDYEREHEKFSNTLNRLKSQAIAKLTQPEPFAFHEPKKKASLRGYLDRENDPSIRNPQQKEPISVIIQRIQQKPKIEPASTKSLNLLMAARRRELEERERTNKEKLIEDQLRSEKQNRLKGRVVNSKSLIDNKEKLQANRSQQKESFLRNLNEQKEQYQQDLIRRLQRVYSKPLMLEQNFGRSEKFTVNKTMQEKLNEILYNNEEDNLEQEEGNEGEGGEENLENTNKEGQVETENNEEYEDKFEDA